MQEGRCPDCSLASGDPWCKEVEVCKSKICKGICAYHKKDEEITMKTPELQQADPEERPKTPQTQRFRPSASPFTPVPMTPSHVRILGLGVQTQRDRTDWSQTPDAPSRVVVQATQEEYTGDLPDLSKKTPTQAQSQANIDVYEEGQRRLQERREQHARQQSTVANGSQPATTNPPVRESVAPEAEMADEEIPRETTEHTGTAGPSRDKAGQKKKKAKAPASALEKGLNKSLKEQEEKEKVVAEHLKFFASRIAADIAAMEKRTGLKLQDFGKQVLGKMEDILKTPKKGNNKDEVRPPATANLNKTRGQGSQGPPAPALTERQQQMKPRLSQQEKATEKLVTAVTSSLEKGTLWTKVVGRKYWPQDNKELAKANKKEITQSKPKKDLRVFLRFEEGSCPDEVVADRNIRRIFGNDNAGILKVSKNRNGLAISVKNVTWQNKIESKLEEIQKAVGFKTADKAEKWDRYIARGIRLTRYIDGAAVTMNEADIVHDLRLRHKTHLQNGELKKVIISPLKEKEDLCNVIVFFAQGTGPKGHVALFGGKIGFKQIGDRGQPSFCRNCKQYHPGMCRERPRCVKCAGDEHTNCEGSIKCAGCFGSHPGDSPSCPLRPRWSPQGWTFPNFWTKQTVRKQNLDRLRAAKAAATRKSKAKGKQPAEQTATQN
ncbi:hypothetical protein AOQ84DRAFT_412077 [Glonium stellatum]|uniref:Gag-like protein n=1 Tax=Glonium stellatum TaxID=574774 RepID=A0A8E2EX90_9PEZI|nr:hypothetical protein AOQ84DRAFT_412077 [Glonium stellatum]